MSLCCSISKKVTISPRPLHFPESPGSSDELTWCWRKKGDWGVETQALKKGGNSYRLSSGSC